MTRKIYIQDLFIEIESSCAESKTTPRLCELFLLREVICIEKSVTFHHYIGGFFTIPA